MVDYDRDKARTRDCVRDPSTSQFRVCALCTTYELGHVERKMSPCMPPGLDQNFSCLNYPKRFNSAYYYFKNHLKAF